MGWEIKNLGSLTSLITDGKHGNCNDEEDSGYYFVSAKNIKNDKINFLEARQIPKDEFEEVDKRTNLQAGDLVMINTGATIGRMAIADNIPETRRCTFQKSVAIIKVKPEYLTSNFLKYVFELRLDSFVSKGSGSAIKNLLLSEMRRFKIIVPPINIQNQFAETIKTIAVQKTQAQASLVQAENLFNSLLQKAFKGELN
jgi:type I restriction enzyme S subunit